jgi:hypothetical protein
MRERQNLILSLNPKNLYARRTNRRMLTEGAFMKTTKKGMEIEFNEDKTTLVKYPENLQSESYIIPNSVTSIGEEAFGFCENLTDETILFLETRFPHALLKDDD